MPLDRKQLQRYSVRGRSSKVNRAAFAQPCQPGRSFADFMAGLPHQLQADGLRDLIEAIVSAHRAGKPVLCLYGAHVVKVGLTPLLCQALEEGWITYTATNGAGTIHDLELALYGETSEDVAAALEDGSFGMAEETGRDWNAAVSTGAADGLGLGAAVGRMLTTQAEPEAAELSIAATAYRLGRPLSVHVAVGADITHMHPEADGAAIGAASYRDFELICERVAELGDGGVVLNLGSAVMMPEVFLKALSVARNLRPGQVQNLVTANLDMQRHYRPGVNILRRPTRRSGRWIELIGPHELLLPMLFQGVCEALGSLSEP